MVDFRRLTGKMKDLVDKRGGTESLKEDAAELQDIAKGSGSVGDKAKAAAAAVKDPGADETAAPAAEAASAPERDRAEQKVDREERGKHKGAGDAGRRKDDGGGRERAGGGGDPAV